MITFKIGFYLTIAEDSSHDSLRDNKVSNYFPFVKHLLNGCKLRCRLKFNCNNYKNNVANLNIDYDLDQYDENICER